jgi:hypothetical protein
MPENNPNPSRPTETTVNTIGFGADVLDTVQDVLKGGRIRSVRIMMGNRMLKEIPVQVAAISAVILAIGAVVISQLHIDIIKD